MSLKEKEELNTILLESGQLSSMQSAITDAIQNFVNVFHIIKKFSAITIKIIFFSLGYNEIIMR